MRQVVFVFVCSRARVIKRSICVRNNFFCVAGKFRYEKYEASKKDIFALWCSFLDKKLFLLPDDPNAFPPRFFSKAPSRGKQHPHKK